MTTLAPDYMIETRWPNSRIIVYGHSLGGSAVLGLFQIQSTLTCGLAFTRTRSHLLLEGSKPHILPYPQRLLLHYYLAPFIWDGQVSAHAASNTFQVMQGYAFFTWQERGAGCELDGDGDPQHGEVEVEFRNPKRVPPQERTPLWTNTPKLSGKLLG